MSIAIEKAFTKKLYNLVGDPRLYTPSLQVRAIHKGRKILNVEYGEHYPFFDLASLTKIIFTASLWMNIFERSSASFEDEVRQYLSWWQPKRKVTIENLLTHSAGLDWWQPYYKKIGKKYKNGRAWRKLKGLIKNAQPSASDKSVYSDLDLFFLAAVSEELFQKSLLDQWKIVQNLFQFKTMTFHPKNQPKRDVKLYAPTEHCPWRKGRMQGQVHDENAFSLGGVAPHSGLFGSMGDLENYVSKIRESYYGAEGSVFDPATVRMFAKRQVPRSRGDFGYLFMKPTKGKASCGKYFDDSSFGHTGFTGTSIWMNPSKDVSILILSDRVYLGRDVPLFNQLRPRLHDLVMELL